jgi:hypothetical protein
MIKVMTIWFAIATDLSKLPQSQVGHPFKEKVAVSGPSRVRVGEEDS